MAANTVSDMLESIEKRISSLSTNISSALANGELNENVNSWRKELSKLKKKKKELEEQTDYE